MIRPEDRTAIEIEIINLLHKGDKRAVELIFQHYGRVLLGTIVRIVQREEIGEDVLQEALVKIWKNGKSYDRSKGRLFTWLINICRHAAIDKTRSKEYKNLLNIQQGEKTVDKSSAQTSYMLPTDAIGMSDWVDKLEEKYREVIDIVYFRDYSHADAAKSLGIPLGTLKTRVRDALKELRRITKD